jgi:uncharacterized protein
MLFPRRLFKELKEKLPSHEMLLVTGMRKTGKSTLARMLFESLESTDKAFLDLEKECGDDADFKKIQASLRENGVTPARQSHIFLDAIEAHTGLTELVDHLRSHYRTRLYLTGTGGPSVKGLLQKESCRHISAHQLTPLDFEEFLVFKKIQKEDFSHFAQKAAHKNALIFAKLKKLYDEYLYYGGFPGIVLTEGEEQKKTLLGDILKSYYERILLTHAEFTNHAAFRELMHLMLQRVACRLDITKLAAETGVSRATVYTYLSFLEETHFISYISPFSRSTGREVSGTKKVYLCDNGLVTSFAHVDEGNLFENAVYRDLLKYSDMQYYQKRSGAGIDFILASLQVALTVKRKGSEGDLRKLQKTSEALRLKESYIISREYVDSPGFIPALEL